MMTLKDAVVIVGICLVGVVWLDMRATEYDAAKVEAERASLDTLATQSPAAALNLSRHTARQPVVGAGTLTLFQDKGQYWTEGQANAGYVRFLVDTGATTVALRLEDARAAGIRDEDLDYSVTVYTANGETKAAPVRLETLRVGPITLRDVDAMVVREGLHVSLLGMSFLGRLQKFESANGEMRLTL